MLKFVGMTLLAMAMCLSACGPVKTYVCGRADLPESGFMELLVGSRSAVDPTELWLNICDGGACKTAIHWTRKGGPSIQVDGRNITMQMQKGAPFVKFKREVRVNSVLYKIKFIETDGPPPKGDVPGDIKAVNNCTWLRSS